MHRLSELGAYGVTLHDDDLVPFGSDAHTRDGIIAGFKINDDKNVNLAFIDPSSGKKTTNNGQYKFIDTPALMVKMAPTMFGGTKANGKRQYMDVDIMYMGLMFEDKAEN